jgi:hypothetical protein
VIAMVTTYVSKPRKVLKAFLGNAFKTFLGLFFERKAL